MYHLHKSLVLKILIISAPLATENKIFQNAPQSNAGVGFGILAHSPLHCQTAIENFPKKSILEIGMFHSYTLMHFLQTNCTSWAVYQHHTKLHQDWISVEGKRILKCIEIKHLIGLIYAHSSHLYFLNWKCIFSSSNTKKYQSMKNA